MVLDETLYDPRLPIEEREQIIEELEQSINEERGAYQETPEFIAEIMRRSAALKADPSSGIPWEEVKKKILARRA
ncbi:MAG: addiction module protein [Sphingobacteriaceae bacterium]|nr:MAG: addiction module protein [Sphingobacteriaceae bacterium]